MHFTSHIWDAVALEDRLELLLLKGLEHCMHRLEPLLGARVSHKESLRLAQHSAPLGAREMVRREFLHVEQRLGAMGVGGQVLYDVADPLARKGREEVGAEHVLHRGREPLDERSE